MRNQFCSAAKKKKEGGVIVNATTVTAPVTQNQKIALVRANMLSGPFLVIL